MGVATERIAGDRFIEVETEVLTVRASDGQPLAVTRKRRPGRRAGAPVVLLHGFGQNRFSWHLESMSMAAALVERGFDVHLAELRGHGLSGQRGSTAPAGFDDYVFRDAPAILGAVRKAARRRVFLVGHSLGATIAYALDPAEQKNLAGIVSIAGPSAYGLGAPVLSALSAAAVKAYDLLGLDRLPKPAAPIGFSTAWLAPLFRLPLFDRPIPGMPLALWTPRSIEPDVLAERIVRGFDRTGWEVVKAIVLWFGTGRMLTPDRGDLYERNLAAKDAPIFFVAGNRDRVAPPASVRPAYETVRSKDRLYREFGAGGEGCDFGHLDLIFGRRAPEHVWPAVAEWMRERAG